MIKRFSPWHWFIHTREDPNIFLLSLSRTRHDESVSTYGVSVIVPTVSEITMLDQFIFVITDERTFPILTRKLLTEHDTSNVFPQSCFWIPVNSVKKFRQYWNHLRGKIWYHKRTPSHWMQSSRTRVFQHFREKTNERDRIIHFNEIDELLLAQLESVPLLSKISFRNK